MFTGRRYGIPLRRTRYLRGTWDTKSRRSPVHAMAYAKTKMIKISAFMSPSSSQRFPHCDVVPAPISPPIILLSLKAQSQTSNTPAPPPSKSSSPAPTQTPPQNLPSKLRLPPDLCFPPRRPPKPAACPQLPRNQFPRLLLISDFSSQVCCQVVRYFTSQ